MPSITRTSRSILLSFLAVLMIASFCQAQPEIEIGSDSPHEVQIQGSASPSENGIANYTVLLFDRRIRNTTDGYSPVPLGLPVRWTEPAQLVWDFGDGSPPVETIERVSVGHRYEDQGTYTIKVEISDSEGPYATATREVTVTNRDPSRLRVAAVRGDGPGKMRFTASALDTPADTLTYHWDFGDGDTTEGVDLWTVDHQYIVSGDYTVELTVSDEDEGEASKEIEVKVHDGGEGTDVEWEPLDGEPDAEGLITGFEGKFSGALAGNFDAEVRSLAGLHLVKINSGVCRFTFTTWDNSLLNQGLFILDFPVIPPQGGKFRFLNPTATVVFKHEVAAYLDQKNRYGASFLADPDTPTNPLPPASPYGLDEEVRFGSKSGLAEIELVPGDYIRGTYALTLESKSEDWGLIALNGDFAIDLESSAALAVWDDCNEALPLEITSRYPEHKSEHLSTSRPPIRVRFDQKVNPETVNEQTFQVGYPDSSGEFVQVAGRIVRGPQSFWLTPDEPLQPGVRHTVRVKGGENGVKGVSGTELTDVEADEWHHWNFTTSLDFATQADGNQLLACHMYQTVRDAPLVAGKPAGARFYANWPRLAGVADDAQVESFEARIVLTADGKDLAAGDWYRFVRPDLWDEWAIEIEKADHTGFVPLPEVPKELPFGLLARLEVRTAEDGDFERRYSTRCPVEVWDRQPTLTVDVFTLMSSEWFVIEGAYAAVLPVIGNLIPEIELYLWQLFPVVDVQVSDEFKQVYPLNKGGIVTWVSGGLGVLGVEGAMSIKEMAASWAEDAIENMREQSNADILLLLTPHGINTGGKAVYELPSGQGAAYSLVGTDPNVFTRYVEAAVHEIGHTLTLEHIPYVVTEEERNTLWEMSNGATELWYGGIEGLRMSRDGATTWNKSSVEGNEESSWLVPLMYPRTLLGERAFIANHQYRKIQKMFENLLVP